MVALNAETAHRPRIKPPELPVIPSNPQYVPTPGNGYVQRQMQPSDWADCINHANERYTTNITSITELRAEIDQCGSDPMGRTYSGK